MMVPRAHTFRKMERVTGRTLVEKLFKGGVSRSMSSYPLRAVYCLKERVDGEAPVRILVSVPKRCFKRAVRRNRVKRQVREAYRTNKQLLDNCMAQQQQQTLMVAFIWQGDQLYDTAEVERKMQSLLVRMGEKICQ